MDVSMLSRIQFAANVTFHIMFPSITIALCWYLLYFKMKFDRTGDPLWMRAYRFWVKVFALTFAMGVVTGITMSFQFGTNWPGFMETVGNIAGPLLGYEVLSAFFLEATFLGVMLFGINRVSQKMHTLATALVAVGTTGSAFWILALNSWMQTPAGYEMRGGVAHPTSWLEIIFNPSFTYHFIHMLLASGLTASFFIIGLSAYRILRGDSKKAPALTLKIALTVAAVLMPLQILIGDLHGLKTFETQPEKLAAMEAIWETEKGAPFLFFAIPNSEKKKNSLEIGLPKMASLVVTHDLNGEIRGVNSFQNAPPVGPVFYSFRIMLGVGMLMLAASWLGVWQLRKTDIIEKWLLKSFVVMTFSGWVATIAGWYTSEIGRQPWLVTGILKTSDAATQIASTSIYSSLILYLIAYAVLGWAYVHTLFLMARRSVTIEEITESERSAVAT